MPRRLLLLLLILLCVPAALHAQSAAIASTHFQVTVDGKPASVMHAAMNLYFLNFEAGKHTRISVTAPTDDFWAAGVEVQPWRLGIRPTRSGRTISFVLDGPAKITISRPNDFLSAAEMLFLFANPPEASTPDSTTPAVRYFGPGIHTGSIDARSGDTIYLAPGAVVFGSLNIWAVEHVRVFGRGVIVYDGPQNPADDDGWMHKKNWHCIVMDHAHDITIEGITCVTRSRTWQIQMKDSRDIRFDNVKVIGANEGNANADGMDWLGGGDTVVHDSFFRAADDIFALQSSWEGYGPVAFAVEGAPVTNIRIEHSVLSTSISNVVRAGWPEKNFQGGNFSMTDTDVLHAGIGGCGIPFALMEMWADPNGRGASAGFSFDNVRLEDWYSLVQLMESSEGIRNTTFTDVFGLEQPSLIASELRGAVHETTFNNVASAGQPAANDRDLPIVATNGAEEPRFAADGPPASISFSAGLIQPGQKVRFEAPKRKGLKYEWSFGDGARATGRVVKHAFPDAEGTLLDRSARFRVLLHTVNAAGRNGWAYAPVVVAQQLSPALPNPAALSSGLEFSYAGTAATVSLDHAQPGVAENVSAGKYEQSTDYKLIFTGYIDIPADGGYTFTLLANDAGELRIDGNLLARTPAPFAQVCGLQGNALRPASGSVSLARGLHRIQAQETHSNGMDGLRLLWQGPGTRLADVPPQAFSH